MNLLRALFKVSVGIVTGLAIVIATNFPYAAEHSGVYFHYHDSGSHDPASVGKLRADVVQDSNVNGHPVWTDFGPGPMEAIQDFLKSTKDFESDLSRGRLLHTINPRGYLKRVKAEQLAGVVR